MLDKNMIFNIQFKQTVYSKILVELFFNVIIQLKSNSYNSVNKNKLLNSKLNNFVTFNHN